MSRLGKRFHTIATAVLTTATLARADERDFPIFGSMDHGHVFSACRAEGEFADVLLRATAMADWRPQKSALPLTGDNNRPLLWRPRGWYCLRCNIAFGCVWYVAVTYSGGGEQRLYEIVRIPLDEFRFDEHPPKAASAAAPRADAAWGKVFTSQENLANTDEWRDLGSPFEIIAMSNNSPIAMAERRMGDTSSYFFEIRPVSADRILVWIVAQSAPRHVLPDVQHPPNEKPIASMECFEYRFRPVAYMMPPVNVVWSGVWGAKWTTRAPFCEPFRVVREESRDIFVTSTGKAFARRTDLRTDSATIEPIWAEVRDPILALVEEADSKSTFAFTRQGFFRTKGPVEMKPLDIGPLDQIRTDDPMSTLRHCAQALSAAGLLQPKPQE